MTHATRTLPKTRGRARRIVTRLVQVRCDEEEYEELKQGAAAEGLPIATFIRWWCHKYHNLRDRAH
jgi:predicted DNA binding CopG/RHH family protein